MSSINIPHSHLIFGSQNQFTLSVANNLATREETYHFVYKNYLDKGLTEKTQRQLWFSVFDAHPETATLVVRKQGRVVGTLTVVYDSPWGLPCLSVYPESISQLRQQGRRPAEVISLAVEKGIAEANMVLLKLFDFSSIVSRHLRRATDYVITVHPRHARYYKKKLLFETFGELRSHPKVGNAPATLLRVDFDVFDGSSQTSTTPFPQFSKSLYPLFLPEKAVCSLKPILASALTRMSRAEIEHFFGRGIPPATLQENQVPLFAPVRRDLRPSHQNDYSLAS